ncbi:MAG: hypothetical protein LQ347_005666 [Umbilicaria vellea]|nr:MAG: hypothetical protein LQ347_005666 [Umbilicaria vellea]
MSITSIPRFLLPQEASYHLVRSLRQPSPGHPSSLLKLPSIRHASNSGKAASSTKPLVLEKPSKYKPPSHPARAPPRQSPFPPLSAPEKEAQKLRKYPHMMPDEGTFMYWFLTNRSIHLIITLGTLSTLAAMTFVNSFTHNSTFSHLLPPARDFWSHPLSFLGQYVEVYRLHTEHITAETAERRRKKMDDVKKRAEYRKAHGLDENQRWVVRGKDEGMNVGAVGERRVGGEESGTSLIGKIGDGNARETGIEGEDEHAYANFERRRRPVKKWLGIW